MLKPRIVPKIDPTPLDELLLDQEGRLNLLPARVLVKIPPVTLATWCQLRGRYSLPSLELVEWLRECIGSLSAIEIGAGAGDLGCRLGIPMTDSYVQIDSPEMQLYYVTLGIPPTRPPPDVEKIEGLDAVRKYKPQAVVASWVTQLYQPGDEAPPQIGSSLYGVDELAILKEVEMYIHIGNLGSHGQKRVLRLVHEEYRLPFLFSKAADPSKNVVHVWRTKKGNA